MTSASNHPRHCQGCNGTGWQPGPDIIKPLRTYTTFEPCTHHWSNDEPEDEELISLEQYLARHPEDLHLFTRSRARHPSNLEDT